MQQKKIGVLIGSRSPPFVGGESFKFGQMLSNEFQLDLITTLEVPKKFESYFSVHKYISKSKNTSMILIKDFINCYRYVIKKRPDLLINISQPYFYGTIATIIGKLTKTPVIVRMTGDTLDYFKIKDGNFQKIKSFITTGLFGRVGFYLADGIIVLGPILKNRLLSHGFQNKPIATIPPSINQIQFFPPTNTEKARFKEELGIEKSKKVILFVGRLTKLKGAEILLRIIPQILSKRNDVVFCLVGEGPYYDKFRSLDQNNVKLIGKADHETIDVFYKAANLFIFPSLTEGHPLVILEALACGVPIAASGVGEIPGMVTAIFKDENEYVDYILKNEWKKDKLPEEFSWDKLKEKHKNFFNEIIEKYDQVKPKLEEGKNDIKII
jgi:glycosyltransferase involved in cell wall biosynthesis